jgi:hypothetical protein
MVRASYIAFAFREMFDEWAVNLRKVRGAKYFVRGQDSMPFPTGTLDAKGMVEQ